MDRLTVSRLAAEAGTSPDTLRYYERIGLLDEPQRSSAGYRLYDTDAVDRVRFIKRAQRFGLRLADIADLVAVRQRGLCPCGGTRRLLESRMAELDREMAALSQLRRDIAEMLADRPDDDDRVALVAGEARCDGVIDTGSLGLDEEAPDRSTTYAAGYRALRPRADESMTVTQSACACGCATLPPSQLSIVSKSRP